MMLRFAFTLVLAMHAWSSVLLAACPLRTDHWTRATVCYPVPGPNQAVVVQPDGWPLLVDATDFPHFVEGPTPATKGDIDAINKRLDHIEELLRQEACHRQFGAKAYCP
jgi:hypothetical protein